MTFAKNAESLLKFHEDTRLAQFIPLIKHNFVLQGIQSSAQIFKTIKIATLKNLLYFTDEQTLMKTILKSQNLLQVQISFADSLIIFKQKSEENISKQVSGLFKLQSRLMEIQQGPKVLDKEELKRKMDDYLNDRERNFAINQDLNEKMREKLRLIEEEQDKSQKLKAKNEALRRKQAEEELRQKQEEAQAELELRKIEINKKKKQIQDILKAKGNLTIMILGKRIENLNDNDIEKLTEKNLKEERTKLDNRLKENQQLKERKEFAKQDYYNRAIREQEILEIQKKWDQHSESVQDIIDKAREAHEKNLALKTQLIVAKAMRDDYVGSIQ